MRVADVRRSQLDTRVHTLHWFRHLDGCELSQVNNNTSLMTQVLSCCVKAMLWESLLWLRVFFLSPILSLSLSSSALLLAWKYFPSIWERVDIDWVLWSGLRVLVVANQLIGSFLCTQPISENLQNILDIDNAATKVLNNSKWLKTSYEQRPKSLEKHRQHPVESIETDQ